MSTTARSVLLAATILAMPAAGSAETVSLPGGLSFELPAGWRISGPPEGRTSKTGMTRVQLVCETPECESTQETCTFLLRERELPGSTDAERVRALYDQPTRRYLRIRAVLKSTSRDAEVLRPLDIATVGGRPWYVIETDAKHNMKSGLFAETIIGERYVGVICKTCETGEVRHQAGRGIIASVRKSDERSALARP